MIFPTTPVKCPSGGKLTLG